MNLHQIVAAAIGTINPSINGTLQTSIGWSTTRGGARTPLYEAPVTVPMQVQMLTTSELSQLNSLNIQRSTHKVYINGQLDGVNRPSERGGDLITFEGRVWLVTSVLEEWPDWCCVSVVMQVDQ